MIDWIMNATGDQIVTVMIMIWLTVMLVKLIIKEIRK